MINCTLNYALPTCDPLDPIQVQSNAHWNSDRSKKYLDDHKGFKFFIDSKYDLPIIWMPSWRWQSTHSYPKRRPGSINVYLHCITHGDACRMSSRQPRSCGQATGLHIQRQSSIWIGDMDIVAMINMVTIQRSIDFFNCIQWRQTGWHFKASRSQGC